MKSKQMCLSFVLFSLVCYSQSDSTIQYDTLVGEGYKIICPKSWEYFFPKIGGCDLLMMEPDATVKNHTRSNVNVVTLDEKRENMDLDKIKKENEDALKKYCHDFVLMESVIKKDGDISYYEYAYTSTKGRRHLIQFGRCFIKNSKQYLALFTGGKETYDNYKKIAENIINSFRPAE